MTCLLLGTGRVTMRPGFPGQVLFLGPCPGGFPEIWLLHFAKAEYQSNDRVFQKNVLMFSENFDVASQPFPISVEESLG